MQLSNKDRAYIRQNYNFNQRQFTAFQKAYSRLSHRFDLDDLLEEYRKLAFTPDQIIRYADRILNNTSKIRYIPKQEVEQKKQNHKSREDKQETTKLGGKKEEYKQKQKLKSENRDIAQVKEKQTLKDAPKDNHKQKEKKHYINEDKRHSNQRKECSNGLYLQGHIDIDTPIKVYYELRPDGTISNFALQSLSKH